MIEPLHTAMIGGQPLRFFATPLDDGLPDLPWHAVDDLYRCLGLSRAERRHLRQKAKKNQARTIATADGIISVAPHFAAQGTIGAMIQLGHAPATIRHEYDLASAEALKKLSVPAASGTNEWFGWLQAAMDRWGESDTRITETEYLLTEGQCLYLTMCAAGDKEHDAKGAKDICHDMVKVIMAWRRGKLLPKWEVPELGKLCKDFETPDAIL